MLTCLAAIGIGLFVLRSTDRSAPAPQTVVQPAASTPAERPADENSPATPAPAAPAAVVSSGRIAFIDPDGRLGTVAPDGADTRLLSGTGWRFQFPAWSPDGRQIAAIGSNGEQGAVRVFSDEPAAKETEVYGSRTQVAVLSLLVAGRTAGQLFGQRQARDWAVAGAGRRAGGGSPAGERPALLLGLGR